MFGYVFSWYVQTMNGYCEVVQVVLVGAMGAKMDRWIDGKKRREGEGIEWVILS